MTGFLFDHSYARLPGRFYAEVTPEVGVAPRLVKVNAALAERLGLDPAALASPEGVAGLGGGAVPEGALPIATAYAGHQFGHFVPQLGDGRAILLGEQIAPDGTRWDIQLKGAGRTKFSRQGDGRAALGPVLREYLVSEAMALGIPTTRALAAVLSGERVRRERVVPGAVLTRVAASHIRVGTFQYFAAREDTDGLRALAQHVISRHYPECADARALLDAVIARQAALVARWLLVGVVHGVMNTDTMSIAGETIDFGPCAFLDVYAKNQVFSSIDEHGRYAYARQPAIAAWNLARLAEAMLPLLGEDEGAAIEQGNAALAGFAPAFNAAYWQGLREKLGLFESVAGDEALMQDWFATMEDGRADFTLAFRGLTDGRAREAFADPSVFDGWWARYQARLGAESLPEAARRARMRAANPRFIPRNHQIEAVIEAALMGDYGPFERMNAVLGRPFEEQEGAEDLAAAAPLGGRGYRTFCGT